MAVPQNETVLETIERRLIPDEQAKKARGEVFTPLNLVRELLYGLRKTDLDNGDLLPWGVDKENITAADDDDDRVGGIPLEVWRDPDCKWLDPANGIGNFPFVAFHMLDFQLKNHGTKGCKEWSDEKRRKHIVEKMLYMIEIDKGNVNTSFKIMDYLASGSKPNICCADTLKLKEADLQRHFGVSKFDVVMGNPPFQAPITGKRFSGKTPQVWDKFIVFALNLVKPGGNLAFITPPQWRASDSYPIQWKMMTRTGHVKYLRIFNKKDSYSLFKVVIRIDMYLIQKESSETPSLVVDENNAISMLDLREWPFLPNYDYDDVRSILTSKDAGIKIIYTTAYHSSPSASANKPTLTAEGENIHPVVHNINKNGLGIRYVKDNTKGHFGVPKVILNKNEQQYPYNDHEGKYGMSEMSFGIPIASKEEGDQIVEAINSDAFRTIIKATKWGSFYTNYHMFEYFRPDFYKQFLNKPAGGVRVTKRKQSRTSSRKTRRSPSR